MPGELFSLAVEMMDELNQSASGFLQLDVRNENNQVAIQLAILQWLLVCIYIAIN